MPSERFQFSGSDGLKLAATLDLPDADPIAYALFALTCARRYTLDSRERKSPPLTVS